MSDSPIQYKVTTSEESLSFSDREGDLVLAWTHPTEAFTLERLVRMGHMPWLRLRLNRAIRSLKKEAILLRDAVELGQ